MRKFSVLVLSILMLTSAAMAAEKSVDAYRADLKSEDDSVVIAAAKALGQKKSKEAINDLIDVIKSHENPVVRITVADSLGRMGTKEQPTKALNEVVQSDKDNSVVYAALLAILNLADFTNPAAEQALDYCEQNKSDDPYIADVVKKIRKAMGDKKK